MTTLPNMSIILPTLGGDSGTWDDKINAGFGLVDAHDHTSGKGVAVPTAGLDIDADLSFGGFGATALGKTAFSAVTPLAAGTKTLFVSSADNELYWRTQAGVNVQLTDGSSINTSLVGGIVGDYSSVGAELAYDDANKTYTFKDQSSPTKKWARLASGPVRIHEYNTTESVYVEFAVAAALAVSYTVTWPAALPATQKLVQISAAGLISYSNTLGVDENVVLSGTGSVLHSEVSITDRAIYRCGSRGVGGVSATDGSGARIDVTAGTAANFHTPPIVAGATALKIKLSGVGSGLSTAPAFAVNSIDVNGAATNRPVTSSLTGAATSDWVYTLTITTPFFMNDGDTIAVTYTPAGATAAVYTITLKYDRR